jgi:uncharacterized small protein (DUF1192 family)
MGENIMLEETTPQPGQDDGEQSGPTDQIEGKPGGGESPGQDADQPSGHGPLGPKPEGVTDEDWKAAEEKYQGVQRKLTAADQELRGYRAREGDLASLRSQIADLTELVNTLAGHSLGEVDEDTARQTLKTRTEQAQARTAQETRQVESASAIQKLITDAGLEVRDERFLPAAEPFNEGKFDVAEAMVRQILAGIQTGNGTDSSLVKQLQEQISSLTEEVERLKGEGLNVDGSRGGSGPAANAFEEKVRTTDPKDRNAVDELVQEAQRTFPSQRQ